MSSFFSFFILFSLFFFIFISFSLHILIIVMIFMSLFKLFHFLDLKTGKGSGSTRDAGTKTSHSQGHVALRSILHLCVQERASLSKICPPGHPPISIFHWADCVSFMEVVVSPTPEIAFVVVTPFARRMLRRLWFCVAHRCASDMTACMLEPVDRRQTRRCNGGPRAPMS